MGPLYTTIVIKLTDESQFNKANELLQEFSRRECDLADEFNLFQVSLDTWQYQYEDIEEGQNSDYEDRLDTFENALYKILRTKEIKNEVYVE